MSAGLADLLACVAAFARSLEGEFDPQRFLRDFSTQAQALVPHEGMFIAWLEDRRGAASREGQQIAGGRRARAESHPVLHAHAPLRVELIDRSLRARRGRCVRIR
jgi:hypothetical protein